MVGVELESVERSLEHLEVVRRAATMMAISPTTETTTRTRPTCPRVSSRAPPATNTIANTTSQNSHHGASSIVSQDAKKLGASSRRLRRGKRALTTWTTPRMPRMSRAVATCRLCHLAPARPGVET